MDERRVRVEIVVTKEKFEMDVAGTPAEIRIMWTILGGFIVRFDAASPADHWSFFRQILDMLTTCPLDVTTQIDLTL